MVDKVVWEGDGHTFVIKSDNVIVLETPFGTLAEPATEMLGKDPATGKPMWASPKPQVIEQSLPTIVPVIQPVAPKDTSTCSSARCGSAQNMQLHLTTMYEKINGPVNWVVSTFATFGLTRVLDELKIITFTFSTPLRNILEKITPNIVTAIADSVYSPFGDLNDEQKNELIKPIFCMLTCAPDGGIIVTPAMINAWNGYIGNDSTFSLDLFKVSMLSAILTFTPISDWETIAQQGGDSGSCDTYDCLTP